MYKLCSGLGVLVSFLSVGSACWAQIPQLVRSPPPDVQTYLILLESCELVSPGFKAATDSVNEPWRRQNAAEVAAVEASAEFKAALAATPQRVRTLGSKDLEELKDMCGQLRHALEVRPRDARLATPTKTWELFLASLRAGDHTTTLACLTGKARRDFRQVMQSAPDSSLRQMGNGFAKFGITDSFRQGGSLQEGFAVSHDGQGHFIYFEERNGEWLISDM
jgi:hypothetical protein